MQKNHCYLKCCLHAHSEHSYMGLKYQSSKKLILGAEKWDYDVLVITNHDKNSFSKDLQEFSENKNILLIPGMETSFGKDDDHVSLINVKPGDYPGKEKIRTFNDFKSWVENYSERENILVIANHPFYWGRECLGDKLEKYIDIFDGIEYSFFRVPLILESPNKKAIKMAEKHEKPILGVSDAHRMWQLGTTSSWIKSERNPQSIVRTVKESKFKDCEVVDNFENALNPDKKIITETRYLNPIEVGDVLMYVLNVKINKCLKRS